MAGNGVSMEQNVLESARAMARLALTKKAQNVILLDLQNISTVADGFLICHGDSDVQVKAIADAVMEGMKEQGARAWHYEGYEYLRWILLDYVDIVVHVFQRELREFYGLEKLWGDATVIRFDET